IWAAEVASGRRWLVSDEPLGAFSPAVSPDGGELAVSRYEDDGLRVVTLPVEQARWIPEENVPREDNPFLLQYAGPDAPDSPGASGAEEDRSAPLLAARVHNYRPFAQLLPRGWLPFVYEDEEGISPALYALGADALGEYGWSGFLAISPGGAPASFDFSCAMDWGWPLLTLRGYSRPDHVHSGVHESWWRLRGGSIRVALPLIFENNVYSGSLQPYVTLIGENEEPSRGPARPWKSRYRGFQAGAGFSRLTWTPRYVVYRNGISLRAFHDRTLTELGSEYDGQRTNLRGTVYVPSPIRHHTLAVTTTYEWEKGDYNYSSAGSVPIGHSERGREHELRQYTAYHFPLAYIEWKLPWLPVYLDVLSGRVFHDWGTSWDRGSLWDAARTESRNSVGVGLYLRTMLFAEFPAAIDLTGYYQADADEWRLEATADLPGIP
ncbi:MAG: hypothetical protein V1774_07240, partial [Candidatus Eisenbacteria bacterium]